jgi:hypothetical protein
VSVPLDRHVQYPGCIARCPIRCGRVSLPRDHVYGSAYRCPHCGEQVPADERFSSQFPIPPGMQTVLVHEDPGDQQETLL